MNTLALVPMVVAAVAFGFAAFAATTNQVKVIAIGLLAWALAILIPAASALRGS